MMRELPRDMLSGWVVVVVDDEDDSLEVAEIILLSYGAIVHTGVNGAEGVALIKSIKPRFAISDLSMPVMDGWGLIHTLRSDPEFQEIPVFALTAHAMIGDRERAVAAGFTNYMTKPLNAAMFIQELVILLLQVPVLAADLKIEGA